MKRISSLVCALLAVGHLQAEGLPSLGGGPAPRSALVEQPPGRVPALRPGVVTLSPNEVDRLLHPPRGRTLSLPSLDQYTGNHESPLDFRAVDLFAPGARIHVVAPSGVRRLDPLDRQFFVAANVTTGLGLALDRSTGEVSGFANKGGQMLAVYGHLDIGLEFTELEPVPEGSNECSTTLDGQPPEAVAFLQQEQLMSQSAAASGTVISYQTVIAIDTDNEWMAGKGNNTTTATNWITDLFLAMNVFYERDVEMRLLIGDVILRVAADPYSVTSSRSAQLDEFGEYWRVNMAGTDRDFAAMLSGRGTSSSLCSGCFSGIAWLHQHCNKGVYFPSNGRTVGSYSFNAIGSSRTAGNTALFVGHEIAHNFGSPHTHCYSPALDQCYASESGCYSGPVSCPAAGRGTIMSYCHVSTSSGGAGCGSSFQEFHPTVQTLLQNEFSDHSPSCIDYYVGGEPGTPIFDSSFE